MQRFLRSIAELWARSVRVVDPPGRTHGRGRKRQVVQVGIWGDKPVTHARQLGLQWLENQLAHRLQPNRGFHLAI